MNLIKRILKWFDFSECDNELAGHKCKHHRCNKAVKEENE